MLRKKWCLGAPAAQKDVNSDVLEQPWPKTLQIAMLLAGPGSRRGLPTNMREQMVRKYECLGALASQKAVYSDVSKQPWPKTM